MFRTLLLLSQYSLCRSTLRTNSPDCWLLYIQALYKHMNKCKDAEEELLAAAQGRPSQSGAQPRTYNPRVFIDWAVVGFS
jgi:hypothetical protein